MASNVLITGGAGFIGTNLASVGVDEGLDELLAWLRARGARRLSRAGTAAR